MKKLTAKDLLKEVQSIKKQAGVNPCARELIEYFEDEDLRGQIEQSLGPDGLMYGWGNLRVKSIDVKDGFAYFDGNISGKIPVMKVTPWYETSNHPQVQKAFKELDKELKSFIKKNGLSNLEVYLSSYLYGNSVGYITEVSIFDEIKQESVSFYIGGWDESEWGKAMIFAGEAGLELWSKKFSGDIDRDVAMAVSNMRKFINKDLLEHIMQSRER